MLKFILILVFSLSAQAQLFNPPNPISGTTQLGGTLNFNANPKMSVGNGIDFSATLNSSGTTVSEILKDYEEGTWLPEISCTTTMNPGPGVSGIYTTQSGRYTKVGNNVHLDGVLAWTGVSGTGNMVIVNLPYTPDIATACSFHADGLALTAANYLQGYVNNATKNAIILEQMPTGGASSTAVARDNAVSALRFQCNYRSSSGL